MKEHIINILKEVAANPPSMDELDKKADLIIRLFEKPKSVEKVKVEDTTSKNKEEK